MWFLEQLKNKRTYSAGGALANAAALLASSIVEQPFMGAVAGGGALTSTIFYFRQKNLEVLRGYSTLHKEVKSFFEAIKLQRYQPPYNLQQLPATTPQVFGIEYTKAAPYTINAMWVIGIISSVVYTILAVLLLNDDTDTNPKKDALFAFGFVAILTLAPQMLLARELRSNQKILENFRKALVDDYTRWSGERYVQLEVEHNTLATNHQTLQTDHQELRQQYTNLQTEHEVLKINYQTLQTDHLELDQQYNDLQSLFKKVNARSRWRNAITQTRNSIRRKQEIATLWQSLAQHLRLNLSQEKILQLQQRALEAEAKLATWERQHPATLSAAEHQAVMAVAELEQGMQPPNNQLRGNESDV